MGTLGTCTVTGTRAITVNAVPTLTITPVSSGICAGSNTNITASGTSTTYSWSPSASLSASTGATVTATPASTTTYTVVGSLGTCTVTGTQAITVNAVPILTVTPVSASICNGSNTNITASGASTYSWSPATNLSATTGATVTCSATATRTYTVTGTSGSGCVGTATQTITVNAIPVLTVTPVSAAICAGGNTNITASGASTYSWSPATNLSATTGATVNCSTTATRTYTVTGTSAAGCTGTASQTITVNAVPVLTVTPVASTICNGGSTNITASGATTYSWSPATGLTTTTGATVSCHATATTTYTVTGTNAAGCTGTANQTITVNPVPVLTVTPVASTICNGSSTSITASGASTYSWSPATNLSATTGATVTCSTTSTRTYTVTGTSAAGCTATASQAITVTARPTVASITPSATFVFVGSSVTFTAGTASGTGSLVSYNWSGPNAYSTTGTATTAVLTPTTTAAGGVYSLSVTYSNGCTSPTVVTSPSVTVSAAAPVITGVSPNKAAPGATVTITGTNFNATAANNIVYFGATAATVSSASATSLSVVVPTGATVAPVTVLNTTGGLTGYEDSTFTPLYTNSYFKNDTLNFKNYITLTTTTANSTPYTGAIGDIDGDGKPDLVVNNKDSNTISVFRNTSTSGSLTAGSFTLYSKLSLAGSPYNVKLADIDGDGKLDIVAALSSSIYVEVFRNTTTTTGVPTFATRSDINAGTVSAVLAITDFDGDGKTDIAVSLPAGSGVGILPNHSVPGTISFGSLVGVAAGSVPSGVCFADLDGDGKPDLATVNSGFTGSSYGGSTASVYRNTSTAGSISFASAATLTTGSGPIDIAAADIDGDGKKDLIVTNINDATFSVFRNVATSGSLTSSSFSTRVNFTTGTGTTGVAVGDLNGDGKMDVVISNGLANTISMYRNTASSGSISSSSFATRLDFTTGTTPATVTIGDLDGDGYPDVVAGNSGSNSVTILRNYPLPYIAPLSGTDTACFGGGTTTISDVTTGGTWSLSNTTLATVNATTGVVTGLVAGTDTLTYTVVAGNDTNFISTPIVIKGLPYLSPVTGTTSICASTTSTLSDSVSGGTWSSSNTAVATVSGGVVYGVSLGASVISYSLANSCGTQYATDSFFVKAMQWVGGTAGHETDWNTAANWACGTVPGAGDDVSIPAGTHYLPLIATSASGTTRALFVDTATHITLNNFAVLNVKGDITIKGAILGTGVTSLDGTNPQNINGIASIENLDLNNGSGATISSGASATVNNTLSISYGTLVTNDSLILNSSDSETARIASLPSSASVITGNVKTMQYIEGGYRRFRFWSHPFSTNIDLSQIENYIDVTGAGGSANGFTDTRTNSPSAFWYTPIYGNSGLSYDPGWRAYTSAYGTVDSNRIHPYQGIRLFVRGLKGEGLDGNPYTPSPVTIGMWGPVNQGSLVVHMQKGTSAGQDYNQLGNPYPSPVDIGTIIYNAKAAGNITGGGFFVWNAQIGAAGQFQMIPIGTGSAAPYYLQAYNAFQVRAAHNNDTLNFTESNKASAPSVNLMKALPEYVSLTVYDANYHPWDMFYMRFTNDATDGEDNNDAVKPSGADFNFYSISTDSAKLALDARPYTNGKVIPMGITSAYTQDFIIKAEGMAVPAGGKLYLHDKLLKQYVLLQEGTEYRFTITADKATQGNERFELNLNPTDVAAPVAKTGLQVAMLPNPATDEVAINFSQPTAEKTIIRVLDLSGVCVFTENLGMKQNGSVTVPLSSMASGIYIVELTSGSQKVSQRLIKE